MDDVTSDVVGAAGRVRVGRRRGVRVVGVLLGVSVLSGGVGWVAARSIRSPAEVAARTGSPAASRITAPVEFRVLRSTLFTRGTVRFGSPQPVTLPLSAAKVGSLVVTAPPVKGAVVVEGSKVADVSGRPVLVLQGGTPMYRDIGPGDRGDDVAELKAALTRLGFAAGGGDVYEGVAQRAVSAWMRAAGYEPFGPTGTQSQALRVAGDGVRKANEQVLAAQGALDKGAVPVGADKVLAADEAVRSATDAVVAAHADADKLVAQAELVVVQKQAAVLSAQQAVDRAATDVSGVLNVTQAEQSLAAAKQKVVDADAAVLKAGRGVESAKVDAVDATRAVLDTQATVDNAGTALSVAQAELVAIKAKPAPTVQVSAGVYTVDTESYNASVRQAELAVTSAGTQLRAANSGLRVAQRSALKAADSILDAQGVADAAVVSASQARDAVKVADLRLTQARNSATTPGAPSSPSTGSQSDSGPGSAPPGSEPSGASGGGGGGGGMNPQTVLLNAQAELTQALNTVEPTKTAAVAAIRAADAQVRIANAQRVELTKPVGTGALRSVLASAQDTKTQAAADLARLEATIGIVVPANEVLFFSSLPLRIDESKLVAGDALTGSLMTVTTQRVAVDASVDPGDAPSLRVGQPAEIEATDLGITLPASITKIAATAGTNGADASRIYVEVTPTTVDVAPTDVVGASTVPGAGRKPTLADLNGISVKVTVPISSTNGNVLAVPTAAVSAAADGTTRVDVQDDPAKPTRTVTVTAGLRAEGYVQVTPTRAGELSAGDLVVTGAAGGTQLRGTPGANDRPNPSRDSVPATSTP